MIVWHCRGMEGGRGQDLASNPFSSLFPTLEVAESYQKLSARQDVPMEVVLETVEAEDKPEKIVSDLSDEVVVKEIQELNGLIEEVFLVTLNKFSVVAGSQPQLVHLASLSEILGPHR